MNIVIRDESKVWHLASTFLNPVQFSEWISDSGDSVFLKTEHIRSEARL